MNRVNSNVRVKRETKVCIIIFFLFLKHEFLNSKHYEKKEKNNLSNSKWPVF